MAFCLNWKPEVSGTVQEKLNEVLHEIARPPALYRLDRISISISISNKEFQ